MGLARGIAPTQCHVGANPLHQPFAVKYLFICASVLTNKFLDRTLMMLIVMINAD
jgi:hypothetical protein